MAYLLTCRVCLSEFEAARSDALSCRPACKQKAYRWRVTGNGLSVTPRHPSLLKGKSSNLAIKQILELHFPDARTAIDVTWGKGVFWKGIDQVLVTGCDIEEGRTKDVVADCTQLPFKDNSFDVGVIDLPFMHDTKERTGTSLHGDYRGIGRSDEFISRTITGARELARVVRVGYIIKCKNQVERGAFRHVEADIVASLGNPIDVLEFLPDVTLQTDPKWKTVNHFRNVVSKFLIYG